MQVRIKEQSSNNVVYLSGFNTQEIRQTIGYAGQGTRLHKIVKKLFDGEEHFLRALGIDTTNHDLQDGWRYSYSEDFKNTLRDEMDATRGNIDKIRDTATINLLANLIGNLLNAEINDTEVNITSDIHLPTEEENTLTEKDIHQNLLITNDAVYSLEAKPIKNSTNLEEIKNTIETQIRQHYESQLQTRINGYENQIQELENQLETVRSSAVVEGMKAMAKHDNFVIEKHDGEHYIVYDGKIKAKRVRYRRDGDVYQLNEKGQEDFYINRPRVKLRQTISNNGSTNHEGANHPNAKAYKFCLGDISGSTITEYMENIKHQLETLAPHRGYGHVSVPKSNYVATETEETEDGDEETVFQTTNPWDTTQRDN